MIKKHIISVSIGVVCLVAGALLLAFAVPENVPVWVDFNERIVATASKWWIMILCALPLLVAILQLALSKRCGTFVFQYLSALLVYENMLVLTYLCLEKNFEIGSVLVLPISLTIFLPIAFSVMVTANKIKYLPYKSKLGIRIKYTLKDEFIWKQAHYVARDTFFFGGFLLVICSLIFAFFHVTWIEIPIFVAVLTLCFVRVVLSSKSMYKKYCEMEKKRENLEKTKKSA